MSYGNTFSINAEFAASHQWVTVRKFNTALRVASSQNFSTSEGRRAAKTAISTCLSEFENQPLFGFDQRFPAPGVYVDLSVLDWPNKVTGLLQSLDLEQGEAKDGPSNTEEGTSSAPAKGRSNLAVATSGHYKKDDANHNFYQTIRICQQQLGSGDACYNRSSFETAYNLTWATTANPNK